MSLIDTLAVKVSNLILQGADMSDKQFFEREIQKWKNSPQRIMQIKGHLYYDNEHDILHRKRMMIGEGGELQEVDNLPNNRLIDNQYAKLVNQKANYLLGQPFAIEGENQQYVELLKQAFYENPESSRKGNAEQRYLLAVPLLHRNGRIFLPNVPRL